MLFISIDSHVEDHVAVRLATMGRLGEVAVRPLAVYLEVLVPGVESARG